MVRHRQRQTNDGCGEFQSMINYSLRQNVTTFVIPIAWFANRSQRVLIIKRPLFSGVTRVSLGDVGPNVARGPIKLIRDSPRALIIQKDRCIFPCQVRKEQRQPVSLHTPKRVAAYHRRHFSFPLGICHFDLARELPINLLVSRLHVFTSSAFIYPPHPSQYQSIPQSPAHPPAAHCDTNPSSPPNSQTT